MKAQVHTHRMEKGNHFSKQIVERDAYPVKTFDVPESECMEIRPDWGVYKPTLTLPALERALEKRGAFDSVPTDCQVYFGFQS